MSTYQLATGLPLLIGLAIVLASWLFSRRLPTLLTDTPDTVRKRRRLISRVWRVTFLIGSFAGLIGTASHWHTLPVAAYVVYWLSLLTFVACSVVDDHLKRFVPRS